MTKRSVMKNFLKINEDFTFKWKWSRIERLSFLLALISTVFATFDLFLIGFIFKGLFIDGRAYYLGVSLIFLACLVNFLVILGHVEHVPILFYPYLVVEVNYIYFKHKSTGLTECWPLWILLKISELFTQSQAVIFSSHTVTIIYKS